MEPFDFTKAEVHEHAWEQIEYLRSRPYGAMRGYWLKIYTCDCGAIKEVTGRIGDARPRSIEVHITESP